VKRLYISLNQSESRLYHGFLAFVSLAQEAGMAIVGVYVVDRESLLKLERYRIFVSDEVAHLSDGLVKEGEKRLAKLHAVCEAKAVEFYPVLLEGDPLHDFLRYVNEDTCERKIIGVVRRGCGAMFRDIFDALSRQIVLETPQEVFIVGVKHEGSH